MKGKVQPNQNSFAVLTNNELVNFASKMGVNTCDLTLKILALNEQIASSYSYTKPEVQEKMSSPLEDQNILGWQQKNL